MGSTIEPSLSRRDAGNRDAMQQDALVNKINSKRLAGKLAVITGGSTGMGLATAKHFVLEGMDHVFITGRRKDVLEFSCSFSKISSSDDSD